jgi:phosphohistidine phosphatase
MTSRKLLLVRHAKTEQGSPDQQRALTDRGRRDAAAIGQWLAAHGIEPDLAVVSPARRAQQTWQAAAAELSTSPRSVDDPRLYDNTYDDVIAVVRDAGESVRTLVVVGHNPSMQECVIRLREADDSGAVDEVKTGSVAVFDIEGPWAAVGEGAGRLVAFAVCRG